MVAGPMGESLMGRAQEAGLIDIRVHDLRRWSDDLRHRKVDDRPFGGGAGMVLRPEPLYRALKDLGALKKKDKPWVVYLSPQGRRFDQTKAKQLGKKRRIILLCGHYEGIDERVMAWVDEEISVGDVVLTGGEIPAMVVMDATARLIPGVVGDPESIAHDSFFNNSLDHPHYTRPRVWRRKAVPPVLLSGHGQMISKWRDETALKQTMLKRPDLLKNLNL
jgi:tRNA (guanine37-N1)-methyltransferase